MRGARRPVIGLITGSGVATEKEFHICIGDRADVVTTRIPLYKISYGSLERMLSGLPAAAATLADSDPDVIVFASMTGSCLRGKETVNVLEQQTGIPVLVPSLECVKCLEELGVSRVALVSPFGVELNLLEKVFFDRNNITVAKVISLLENGSGAMRDIDLLTPEDVLAHVETEDFSDVEAVLFDSPTFELLPIAEKLKSLIGKPVLSISQILLRSALRQVGRPTSALYIDSYFST